MGSLIPERFSRLQFPVHKITAKSPEELFEVLPGLRRYFQNLRPAEVKKINYQTKQVEDVVEGYEECYRGTFKDDLVKVIKYIVYVYDPESDLINEYPDDVRLLKEAACKEAGFHRNKDGQWPLYVQDILDFKEKQVVGWILEYLKVKRNNVWSEIKFTEEELDTLYRQRTAALLKGEIKPELFKLVKERLEEKDHLLKRFYAEHGDLRKATEDDLYPVSPENVFKELKIPIEHTRVRQVKDVSQNNGIDKVRS
ncbi:MAG: hypothetical protein WKF87_06870 [Chryseolinea sp.]